MLLLRSYIFRRTIERGRIKCGQYWPAEEDTTEQYDQFLVTNEMVEQSVDCTVTKLLLTDTMVSVAVATLQSLAV